jgi:phosphatidate cytidylyltransferase
MKAPRGMADFKDNRFSTGFGRFDDTVPGEGGSYSFLAGLEKRRGWRENLRRRLFAGIPALIVVLAVVALAPVWLAGLLVVLAGAYGVREYVKLVEAGLGYSPPRIPMVVAATVIGLGGLFGANQGMQAMFFLSALALVFWVWFRDTKDTPRQFQNAGAALLGLMLVPWLINHLTLMLQLPEGRGAVGFLVMVITLNDTSAYLVGSLMGKRPLIPSVSPHKTIEGSIAGLIGGLCGGLISSSWLGAGVLQLGIFELSLLGIFLAAVAQGGDLLESKLKRLTYADESGLFLPGHGGLLDRVDSYLLAAPLLYYFLLAFYL